MSLPTEDECLNFLRISKNAIPDQRGSDWYWWIGGAEYPERQAVKLAEYCLITGQALTSIATIDGMLNIVRRIVVLEERARKPWWRRG